MYARFHGPPVALHTTNECAIQWAYKADSPYHRLCRQTTLETGRGHARFHGSLVPWNVCDQWGGPWASRAGEIPTINCGTDGSDWEVRARVQGSLVAQRMRPCTIPWVYNAGDSHHRLRTQHSGVVGPGRVHARLLGSMFALKRMRPMRDSVGLQCR